MKQFKYSIVFITTLFSITGMVLIVFFSSIKYNPIQGRYDNKKIVFTLLPQGWSFFTRNPREAQVLVYKLNKDDGLELIRQKHSEIVNLIGLNRIATVLMSETQLVRSKITDNHFINTKWNYQAKRTGKFPSEAIEIENEVANPKLCGEHLLVFQQPIPWAWSKNLNKIMMPAKVVRINILCNE